MLLLVGSIGNISTAGGVVVASFLCIYTVSKIFMIAVKSSKGNFLNYLRYK